MPVRSSLLFYFRYALGAVILLGVSSGVSSAAGGGRGFFWADVMPVLFKGGGNVGGGPWKVGGEGGVEVSFRADVMPVLSKAGCNAGGCHGNGSGKGGMKLSLRGQDPELDWEALARDQGGRRVNLLAPETSLLLLKATGTVAHEGGKRFGPES